MLGRDDQDDTPGSCLRFQTMKELRISLISPMVNSISLQWLLSKVLSKKRIIPHSGGRHVLLSSLWYTYVFHLRFALVTSVICWLWSASAMDRTAAGASGEAMSAMSEFDGQDMCRMDGQENRCLPVEGMFDSNTGSSWFLGVAYVGYVGAGVLSISRSLRRFPSNSKKGRSLSLPSQKRQRKKTTKKIQAKG